MGCLPLAVTTQFCLTRGSKRSLVWTDWSAIDGDQNVIWRYFVSMRLYLPMLLWFSMKVSGIIHGGLFKKYFIDSEPKGEVISSKIDRLAAIYISKFKRARQAQFLSHTLKILEINISFKAVKRILINLIKISFSFWILI